VERGLHVLDLDPWLEQHPRLLGAGSELTARGVVEAMGDVIDDEP
jgi:hypothetical protein